MAYRFFTAADARTIPIIPIETAVFSAWLASQPDEMRRWVQGDHDEHDMIVERYKNQILARREAEERDRESRL